MDYKDISEEHLNNHVDRIIDICREVPLHKVTILTGGNACGKSVIRKQLAIAASFRKLSNALAVKAKQAENKADRDIKTDDRKARIDDVETSPAETDGGPLF